MAKHPRRHAMSSVGTVPAPVLTNVKQDRRGEHQRLTEMERLPFVGCRDIGRRFPIQIRILFRPKGQHEWRTGWTENMSRSGVLFHTHTAATAETDIEIRLVLEFEASLATPPEIVCAGRIVRATGGENERECATVAAQFTDYRFLQARSAIAMFTQHDTRAGRVN
jgi:hypothetical protein